MTLILATKVFLVPLGLSWRGFPPKGFVVVATNLSAVETEVVLGELGFALAIPTADLNAFGLRLLDDALGILGQLSEHEPRTDISLVSGEVVSVSHAFHLTRYYPHPTRAAASPAVVLSPLWLMISLQMN